LAVAGAAADEGEGVLKGFGFVPIAVGWPKPLVGAEATGWEGWPKAEVPNAGVALAGLGCPKGVEVACAGCVGRPNGDAAAGCDGCPNDEDVAGSEGWPKGDAEAGCEGWPNGPEAEVAGCDGAPKGFGFVAIVPKPPGFGG
jgi:hypothetical protein